ncbi:MAG: LysM peptidoglycan-binding domain-containing protein [Gammaproteobacteria bacterium]|nr:LysM peptidoglycan-binding domain-containing protein [Gammaproteobacteria bacterium]
MPAAAGSAAAPAAAGSVTLQPGAGSATATAAPSSAAEPFPLPPGLEPTVAFWTDVFAKYSENESLIHDGDDPARIYQRLDFRSQAQQLSDTALARVRAAQEQQASAETIEALKQLAVHGGSAAGLSTLAQHIRELFPADATVARLRQAANAVRMQRGIRERTGRALQVAGRYLPAMEQIFAGYHLPLALTRLPLVESSFNLHAYSKAGAAGIWQFIPSSARIYMTLDQVEDDRRDPWTSTDAAARHLRDDYDALGQWPLAITAYNYGRTGLLRGLEQVHGSTLADLLARLDSPRFGFASRNFYAEFLAALRVSRQAERWFDALPKARPIVFAEVRLNDYLDYGTARSLSGTDAATFAELNPAFTTPVVEGRLYLPPGTTIRVPPDRAQRFETLYAALDPSLRHDRQRVVWPVAYRVQRGDVLGGIAARHHVSVDALMRANDLRSARLIRVGEVLKIPTGGAAAVAHAIAVADHPRSRTRHYLVHRVRSGQTLSGIAQRYGASIGAILQLNDLRDADVLRAGMRLKIPRPDY